MIKIVGGQMRGLLLASPEGESTRPTKSIVREAVFNSLANQVDGCHFLDLYSGAGTMAFESWSWGAAHISCIEANTQAYKSLQQNYQKCLLYSQKNQLTPVIANLHHCLAIDFLKDYNGKKFDIIYFDPPYSDIAKEIKLCKKLLDIHSSDPAILITECTNRMILNHELSDTRWTLLKSKKYGKTSVEFWRKLINS